MGMLFYLSKLLTWILENIKCAAVKTDFFNLIYLFIYACHHLFD